MVAIMPRYLKFLYLVKLVLQSPGMIGALKIYRDGKGLVIFPSVITGGCIMEPY